MPSNSDTKSLLIYPMLKNAQDQLAKIRSSLHCLNPTGIDFDDGSWDAGRKLEEAMKLIDRAETLLMKPELLEYERDRDAKLEELKQSASNLEQAGCLSRDLRKQIIDHMALECVRTNLEKKTDAELIKDLLAFRNHKLDWDTEARR